MGVSFSVSFNVFFNVSFNVFLKIDCFQEALNFWLEKEVDGFRLIGVEHLFKPKNLEDANMVCKVLV